MLYSDAVQLGVEMQVKRVLEAMGEGRILDGITAFETGMSSWSACFFARAYPELNLDNVRSPENAVADALGMPGNRVPMRIVYTLFDGVGCGRTMSKQDLLAFIRGFLDDKRSPDVQKAIEEAIAGLPVDFSQPVWDDKEVECRTMLPR